MDAKGRKSEPVCIDDEIPFEIPEGWEWTRLESLIDLLSGVDLSSTEYNDKQRGIPYLTGASNFNHGQLIENRWTECPRRESRKGDLLFTCKGTVGEMAINSFDRAHIARQIMAIRPTGDNCLSYLEIFLGSLVTSIRAAAKGVIPGIERATLLVALVPVPPLAEQRRIAGRVSELTPLVEEYGRLEDEREALDAALPDRLRKSMLQMAVEGKLVPQDPDDEPASALLEHIRAERARLIKQKKIKAPKGSESVIYLGSDGRRYEKRGNGEPVCIDDEIPFDIPKGWEWARLATFFTKMGSGSTPAGGRKVYKDEGPMLIRSQNVHNDGLRLDDAAHFDRSLFERRSTHVEPNDMLLNITGASIGRCAVAPEEIGDADVNQHVLIMRPICPETNAFIHKAVLSELVQSQIMGSQVGATKEGLSAAKASSLLVPVPPLAEQSRIVERLDSVLASIN